MTKLSLAWENIGIIVSDTLPRVADASNEMRAGEIRAEIARAKINVREMAADLDIPEGTLYKMLSEKLRFSDENVKKIAKYLKKPEGWPTEDTSIVRDYTPKPPEYDRKGSLLLRGKDTGQIAQLTSMGLAKSKGDFDTELLLPAQFCAPTWQAISVPNSFHMPIIHPVDILVFAPALKPKIGYMHIVQMDERIEESLEAWIIDHIDGEDVFRAINKKVVPPELGDARLVGLVVAWFHPEGPKAFDSRVNESGLKW